MAAGRYLNNCGCAEHHFEGEMIDKVMRGSVRMLAEQGWDGVKFDSCSQFHNLTRWAECVAWDAKEKLAMTRTNRSGSHEPCD